MSSRLAEHSYRAVRWVLPAAALTVAPKCVMCVVAYSGLGTALGLGGPEICGMAATTPADWSGWLATLGVAGGPFLFYLAALRRVGSQRALLNGQRP